MEDELARDQGPAEGSHSGSTSPAPSRNPTSGPALVPALIPASVPAPAPAPGSFDELFRQFMKAYLESQKPSRPLAERERSLKAKVPDVYYEKLHIDCYHFCQQCEDHFETAGATGANRTPFAASFLRGNISVYWTQFKCCHRGEELTPITWTEFKAFLQKNLGESKSFVDSIWKKFKRDSQYQHLQSILMEFDPAAAPTESTMVRYFEEGLKPSIKAEMNQDATYLDDYEELVAKAIRAEAKAGLRPSSYVRETDQQVFRGSRPAHTTAHKVQIQKAMKDHCGDESRDKAPVSTSVQDFPSDKDNSRKDKKKKQHKDKWDSTNPATGVNTAEVSGRRRKQRKDISEITCYNCNKKGHYSDKCPEPRRSKN